MKENAQDLQDLLMQITGDKNFTLDGEYIHYICRRSPLACIREMKHFLVSVLSVKKHIKRAITPDYFSDLAAIFGWCECFAVYGGYPESDFVETMSKYRVSKPVKLGIRKYVNKHIIESHAVGDGYKSCTWDKA